MIEKKNTNKSSRFMIHRLFFFYYYYKIARTYVFEFFTFVFTMFVLIVKS